MAETIDLGTSTSNRNVTVAGDVVLNAASGTTSTDASSILRIGNTTASGTAGNNYGVLRIYGKGIKYGQFGDTNNVFSANRSYYMPDKTGVILLKEDIDDLVEECSTLSTSIGKIGTYKSTSGSTTLTAKTTKKVASLSLAAGLWLIIPSVCAVTDELAINIHLTSGSNVYVAGNSFRGHDPSGIYGSDQVYSRTIFEQLTETTTYYMNVYSSTAGNIDYFFEAVRIK